VILLGFLGYFEVTRVQRGHRRRGYGKSGFHEKYADGEKNRDQTSIYASSQNQDAWTVRRTQNAGRQHRSRNGQRQRG
jgi:hypothetical protein